MFRRLLAAAALAAVGITITTASPALANTASTPISDGGVTPYIIPDTSPTPGGGNSNRDCADAGAAFEVTFDYDTSKVDYPGFTPTSFQWTDIGDNTATGEYVTVVTDGTEVAFSSLNILVGAAIVKGSNAANVYYYNPGVLADSGLASPPNASGNPAGLSNLTFCGFEGGPIDEEDEGTLTVEKFYDANANGVFDGTDVLMPGWRFDIDGNVEHTSYSEVVPVGPYTVTEHSPVEPNWMPTTATSFDVEVTAGGDTIVEFGNLCLGAGGGKTLGFWSNKNGQAQLFGATTAPGSLAAMVALNLRTALGADFDPATYAQFRTWILGATATNMANMLSAQLAAMALNVRAGTVAGSSLIYAPGAIGANALGYATVSTVMAEANTSLGLSGTTLAGHADRSYQEALKNALDAANNNVNFVQASPCGFSFA